MLVEYRFEKKNPDDEDFTSLGAFLSGVDLTGTAQPTTCSPPPTSPR